MTDTILLMVQVNPKVSDPVHRYRISGVFTDTTEVDRAWDTLFNDNIPDHFEVVSKPEWYNITDDLMIYIPGVENITPEYLVNLEGRNIETYYTLRRMRINEFC